MKAKPRGRRFRNLYSLGDVIYYQRWVRGERGMSENIARLVKLTAASLAKTPKKRKP